MFILSCVCYAFRAFLYLSEGSDEPALDAVPLETSSLAYLKLHTL